MPLRSMLLTDPCIATASSPGTVALNASAIRFYRLLLRLSRVPVRGSTSGNRLGTGRGVSVAPYSRYATLMHCSRRSVHNYVRALREAGWIETMPMPGDVTAIRPLVRSAMVEGHFTRTLPACVETSRDAFVEATRGAL